jgi:hypothetical protein
MDLTPPWWLGRDPRWRTSQMELWAARASPRSVDRQLTAPLHGIGLGGRFDKRGRPCARDGEQFPWPPGPPPGLLLAPLPGRPWIHARMRVALSTAFLWGFCADEPPCRCRFADCPSPPQASRARGGPQLRHRRRSTSRSRPDEGRDSKQ